MSNPPRMVILPGMGANAQMYPGPWQTLPNASFLDWPKDFIPATIEELAAALLSQLPQAPDILIGSSLGGVVATAMADQCLPRKLFLIGSTTTHTDINRLLTFCAPLAHITPMKLIQVLAGKTPHLLSSMYAEQNPEFIRQTIKLISRYEYTGTQQAIRIHGRHDHVITANAADYWIDGGHLIALTHAQEVVDCVHHALQLS